MDIRKMIGADSSDSETYRTETFEVGSLDWAGRVSDYEIQMRNVSLEVYRDELKQEAVYQFKLMLAQKTLKQNVHFRKTVDTSFETYKTWFDHFLAEHPRIARFLGRKPEMTTIKRQKQVSETKTANLHAMVPKLKLPEPLRRQFNVFYTTSEG